ncbi:MAG TPA: heparan-alpha-glucosaminide N-acetyltransferase domain-containing protein, partial [Bacteroidales bacterium]
HKTDFKPIRRKYIDRGLFLITIAHVVIWISFLPLVKTLHGNFKVLFITDIIGLSLIVGALIVDKVPALYRVIFAVVLYSFTWWFIAQDGFVNNNAEMLKAAFFGSFDCNCFFDVFPFFPWFSLYLMGTVFGEQMYRYKSAGSSEKIARMFLRIGIVSIFAGIFLILAAKYLLSHGMIGFSNKVGSLFAHYQKNPPGLAYLLFYGGCGMIIMVILDKIISRNLFPGFINSMEIVGKSSLFAFMFQYFIYFTVVVLINPPFFYWWPLFFCVTAILIVLVVKFWYEKGFNQYLTILNMPIWKFNTKSSDN